MKSYRKCLLEMEPLKFQCAQVHSCEDSISAGPPIKMAYKHWSLLAAIAVAALLCSTSLALAQVVLGTAESFAVLGGSTVTNTGPTVIIGDVGVEPGSAVTGFPPGIVIGGTIHAADAVALQAQIDNTAAYIDLQGRACNFDLTGQDLGGLTLVPGVYCFSSSAQLTGALTLDAEGDPNAVWVFQIASTLVTASNSSVRVINGGQQCNVFWQVGSSTTLGTTTSFIGSILALTSITLNTGATLSGRALAQTGAVTMDSNTVTRSTCAVPPVIPLPPTLGKAFSPATIDAGGVSTLTITLSNPDTSVATLSAPLTDTLPTGVVIATVPNASTTCVGSTLTAIAGDSTVTLTGGSIPANGSCTVTVDVTAPVGGSYFNSLAAGALQTTNGNNAAPAIATLTVNTPGDIAPTLGKAFSPATIDAGGVSTLTITLSNPSGVDAILTAPLTDTLPTGVVIATVPNASTTCVGSTLTAIAGDSTVTLTGGSIPANGSCTVTVDVTAPVGGSYFNSLAAGALQTTNGNNAAPAIATLTVSPIAPSGDCAKLAIQAVLNPTNGRFPGNLGPDLVVRVGQPFNESIQAAVNTLASSGDLNGDGYIIIMVVNKDDGNLGGHTNQRVEISAQYTAPFALLACSVTMHTPDPSQPSGHILSTADAPLPPSAQGNIFVMDLHGADSVAAAGWQVDGNGRYLRNISTTGNNVGMSFVGNGNTIYNSHAENNVSHGVFVQGDANSLENVDAFDNSGDGIRVIGNTNILSKVDSGDRLKSNGGDGLHVEGDSNQIIEGNVFANSGHGVFVQGNSNKILKTRAGDRSKGNGGDGFRIVGGSNLLDGNMSNANRVVGINFASAAGINNLLKRNQSNQDRPGGSKENGGAEYCFQNATTLDQLNNKKDAKNFGGVGSPKKYATGCYE